MKIAMAQMAVAQADFAANLAKAKLFAARAKGDGADMLVLPEMFACGFNYKKNAEYLAQHQDEMLAEIKNAAKDNGIFLCGSLPFLEQNQSAPANRMLLITPSGEIAAHYDKAHLFSLFRENIHSRAGNEIVVADTPFGKIGLAVCYDLRFPEMFVQMAKRGAKLVIISAAWPYPRLEHWRVLVKARAIENQLFVAAVNQGGTENFAGKTLRYFGDSQTIDPWGETVASCGTDAPDALAFAEIDFAQVEEVRARIPAFKDRRNDLY